MSVGRLVIEVEGREAIPVRAIPYITGWLLSPDRVARQLSGDEGAAVNVLVGMAAYCLSAGIVRKVMPKEWDAILASIYLLQYQLEAEYPSDESDSASPDFGYVAWREQSPLKLPANVFVWRDEFEPAFYDAYSPKNLTIVDERPGERELHYAPLLPAGLTIEVMLEDSAKMLAQWGKPAQADDYDEPETPKQRSRVQDETIIKLLRTKGYNPLALPPNVPGKSGVKSEIRKAIGVTGMWAGARVFDKAWERLSNNGDIAYSA